jgi:alpha,alpha-trehalose phosphorylase
MAVEAARLWADLGFYSERKGGRFCIDGVTGPDEYNTVVNNNAYTNLMAQENLRIAIGAVNLLRERAPAAFSRLVEATGLDLSELDEWGRAADHMYVPYDEKAGVHLQDDGFLDREPWDFEGTPAGHYPLLLHYHPLVIYRHQVIKQADMVLAAFLLGEHFTVEEKRRIFDYYDPLTTGDSSLSMCIQSIVAAEVGYCDKACRYFADACAMDLGDVGGNVRDGLHVAALGGTWMALVYGFAGLRDHGAGPASGRHCLGAGGTSGSACGCGARSSRPTSVKSGPATSSSKAKRSRSSTRVSGCVSSREAGRAGCQ